MKLSLTTDRFTSLYSSKAQNRAMDTSGALGHEIYRAVHVKRFTLP